MKRFDRVTMICKCDNEARCDRMGLCQQTKLPYQRFREQIPDTPLPNPAQLRTIERPTPCAPGSHCERYARGLGACVAGYCNPPAAAGVAGTFNDQSKGGA